MLMLNGTFDSKKNPFYPISINDYPKLFDYVLTRDGLIFFNDLKRKYILGKDLSLDECNKLRLLYIYYATANRYPDEVSYWQDLCIQLEQLGFPEKNVRQSKDDLILNKMITKNPDYQAGLYRNYIQYSKQNNPN